MQIRDIYVTQVNYIEMTVEIAVTNLNTKRAAMVGGRKSRHCPATIDTSVLIIRSIPVPCVALH